MDNDIIGRRAVAKRLLRAGLGLWAGIGFVPFPAAAQAGLPISIGYQANADWLLLVARDLNLFERAGLVPTFEKFVAGPPMIEAARAKRIDVTTVGTVPLVRGLSEGLDWQVIGINPEGAFGEGLVAGSGSGINTIADLPGKRVGFVKGSTAHYGILSALRQLGVRLDQLQLFDMTPAEQLAGLASNQIDAAMVWEPWMQRMIHEANARLIVTEGDMGIYMAVSVYAARSDWLRDRRETAVRFLRALLMASDTVAKDSSVAVKSFAREMGIKEEWAEKIYEDAPPPKLDLWTDPRYRYSLVKGSAFHRRLGYVASFLLDEKVIAQEVDLRNVLNATVVAEALKGR
jgi:aliphatic sulfonates family ABC transporter substrate-binding protein